MDGSTLDWALAPGSGLALPSLPGLEGTLQGFQLAPQLTLALTQPDEVAEENEPEQEIGNDQVRQAAFLLRRPEGRACPPSGLRQGGLVMGWALH